MADETLPQSSTSQELDEFEMSSQNASYWRLAVRVKTGQHLLKQFPVQLNEPPSSVVEKIVRWAQDAGIPHGSRLRRVVSLRRLVAYVAVLDDVSCVRTVFFE